MTVKFLFLVLIRLEHKINQKQKLLIKW